MMDMRQITSDQKGAVGTIILAVATAVTLAISILVVYSIMGGLNTSTIDSNIQTNIGLTNATPAANASDSLLTHLGTFFTVSPLYLVVLVAVAIIGAVMGIMVVKRE